MMQRPPFTAFHRSVIRAGVMQEDATPLSDWTSWAEARMTLLQNGLAFYVYGILVILPHADIEMTTTYG